MKKWYAGNDRMTAMMSELLQSLHEEFGWTTKRIAALSGRYIYTLLKREKNKLVRGWVYEPVPFYEKNPAASYGECARCFGSNQYGFSIGRNGGNPCCQR